MEFIKNKAPELPDEFESIQNLVSNATNSIIRTQNIEFQKFVEEGLKRKGFEFDNGSELIQFIQLRCKFEDNAIAKQKMFFVDDIPFLLHNYNTEVVKSTMNINEPFKISADLGSYTFL